MSVNVNFLLLTLLDDPGNGECVLFESLLEAIAQIDRMRRVAVHALANFNSTVQHHN